MSLQETKLHLIQLLGDAENKVIALSGKWGTGKTHLWHEVMAEANDETVNGALYVSLFGLSGMDQVKRKLIEAVAPGVDAHPKIWEATKQAVSSGLKALEGFHKGFAALSDLNLLLLAPAMLRGKVIVIDDIERKHEKLGVDEILGFIDEYTQRHETRFVLVLNSDQLAKREMWNTLREKVIDHELKLITSPEEAFSVAVNLSPSPYSESIRSASIICRLTNIRIIRKIIGATNRILNNRELEDALLSRVVPSIVLFAAIHYKGMEDGPDLQFALKIGEPSDWGDLLADKNEKPSQEQLSQAKWRLLMNELGIHGCDRFEVLVVDFLESGLFDASKLNPIIDHYVSDKKIVEAQEKARHFMHQLVWNHHLDNDQLLEIAAGLPEIAELLDPYVCTEIERALVDIPGGEVLGQEVINNWIVAFKAKDHDLVDVEDLFGRPLNEAIRTEFEVVKVRAQANTSLVDACMHVIEMNGWGLTQEMAMKRATPRDFEVAIRSMEIAQLPRFMRRMIEMRINRQTYDHHFGTATEHFVEACRAIANDQDSVRLAGLIKRLFEKTVLAAELASPEADPAVESAQ